MAMPATYTIKLPQFEGPFDLLLFFIERDELDIHDIPIAQITNDFLEYIKEMERLNIDLASEFILVAATLMRIKARLLLPRKPVDEEGNEIDPRQELVDRLIEYKKYKSVLDELREMEQNQAGMLPRGNRISELTQLANRALVDAELESVTMYKLLKAYKDVMERYEFESSRKDPVILRYPYTVKERVVQIVDKLMKRGRSDFKSVFDDCTTRIQAIFTFLALLELVQTKKVYITTGEGYNNFWVEPHSSDEEE